MIEKNKAIHEYTGVAAWHAAGYTGKGIRVATAETLDPVDWPGKLVHSLRDDVRTSDHSAMTTGVLFEVAPDVEVYAISTSNNPLSDPPASYLYHVHAPQLEELGVHLLFSSLTCPSPMPYEKEWAEEYVEKNDRMVQFWAAGNDGNGGYNRRLQLPDATGVGAYQLINGKPLPAGYTSETEYVAFAAPTNTHYQLPKWDGSAPSSGTSSATPYLCGMAALVQQFFTEKTGAPLNREALLQFFRDNCVDIGSSGKDVQSGYGAVVLPDPATIDVLAYQEGRPKSMKVNEFKDANQIPEWAKDGVQFCLDAGIMDGVGNNLFDPNGPVTRAQLATVMYRANKK